MLSKRFPPLALTVLLAIGLMALMAGCALDEGPLSPKKETDHPEWLRYDLTGEEGLAKRVRIKGAQGGPVEEDYVEKLIKADKGGKLILGEIETLKATLVIDDDALSEDTVIGMGLPEPGKLVFDFSPDGLVFEDEVLLKIESKTIELEDPDSITLWYSKDGDEWEEEDAEISVKRDGKTVVIETEIDHFSRYAFAGSDYNSYYYNIW